MFRSRAYRYDNEQVVLVLTLLLVLGVIILTATVTFCLSAVFIIAMFVISALLISAHHKSLMEGATAVTPNSPRWWKIASVSCSRVRWRST